MHKNRIFTSHTKLSPGCCCLFSYVFLMAVPDGSYMMVVVPRKNQDVPLVTATTERKEKSLRNMWLAWECCNACNFSGEMVCFLAYMRNSVSCCYHCYHYECKKMRLEICRKYLKLSASERRLYTTTRTTEYFSLCGFSCMSVFMEYSPFTLHMRNLARATLPPLQARFPH